MGLNPIVSSQSNCFQQWCSTKPDKYGRQFTANILDSRSSTRKNDVRNVENLHVFQNGGRECSVHVNRIKIKLAALRRARKQIYHACKVWIDKSVPRITVWHLSASLVMPNCDPRDIFVYPSLTFI